VSLGRIKPVSVRRIEAVQSGLAATVGSTEIMGSPPTSSDETNAATVDAHSDRASLVFVLGMLRSGTTMFAQMLGQHPAVFAAGELANFWQALENGSSCQCGRSVSTCPVWAEVHCMTRQDTGLGSLPAETLRRSVGRTRHLRALQRQAAKGHLTVAEAEYANLRSRLVENTRLVSGASVVVDTSKLAIDLAYLASGHKTVAVHMLRDPFQVAASESDASRFQHLPPVDRPPVRSAAASAMLWTFLNAQDTRVSRTLPLEYLCVRIEDVLRNPVGALSAVVATAGLPAHSWQAKEGYFHMPGGHIMNGNPSRGRTGWQQLRPSPTRLELGWVQQLAVRIFSAPHGRYGYDAPHRRS
jgi:Sulfotransferase family